MHADVMEHVAEDRPQELRLRVLRFAQELQALGRRTLEDAADEFVRLGAAVDVAARLRVEHLDRLAFLLVETGARLLAERALLHELGQHGRRLVDGEKRIVGEVVLHRLDDVRHRVEADHVRRAERRRLRAAEARSGQVVDFVETQAEFLRFGHHRENREDADAVRDEVRRVLRAHDALADDARQEGLEVVENGRTRMRRGNQLDEMHVTRRIEEVHAAEARLQFVGKAVRQLRDRQPRRVRREDRVRRQMRRHLLVQVVLPVHALGDRFDHEVAFGELRDVVVVVRGLDVVRVVLDAERRGRQLLQVLDRLQGDSVFRACLGGQVEQQHRHLGVDQVRGDLRAHHAGAEHGHLANDQIAHVFPPWSSAGPLASSACRACLTCVGCECRVGKTRHAG